MHSVTPPAKSTKTRSATPTPAKHADPKAKSRFLSDMDLKLFKSVVTTTAEEDPRAQLCAKAC